MLIRCIDFETTGEPTPDDKQAICEAGYADIDGEPGCWQITDTWSSLCRPGRPMPPEASGVHHITDGDLADAPAPDYCYLKLGEGGPDIYVAHKADFEQHFFSGGDSRWICTYKVSLRLWPDAPTFSLQGLRYFLDLPVIRELASPAHRAGPDSYIGAHLMARILSDARVSIDDMVRWSAGPALLPKIMIGEHRGKPWSQVPTHYLEWIVGPKNKLERDIKANARHELKLRETAAADKQKGALEAERLQREQWAREKEARDAVTKGATPPGGF